MGPHLVWAFVVLCGFGAMVWLRVRHERESDLRSLERATREKAAALTSIVSVQHDDLAKRLDAIESDLKPIKQKVNNSEFGKLGGAR